MNKTEEKETIEISIEELRRIIHEETKAALRDFFEDSDVDFK